MVKQKIIVFDMDGVLVDIESSWRYIHDYFGTDNKENVEAYLQGRIGDEEFIKNDLLLWRENEVCFSDIKKIFEEIPLMNGTKECIGELKKHGIKTAILSGGVNILAKRIARETGIDYVLANSIDEKLRECIIRVSPKGKDRALINLAEKLNVPRTDIVSVGNSHYDVKMFHVSGLGIAFNPSDEEVKKHADVVIKEKDLRKVVPVALKFWNDGTRSRP